MTDIVAFGRRLKRFLKTDQAYAILDSDPRTAGTSWAAGGCWVVAKSLLEVFPAAELVGVFDGADVQHHVVVWMNGRFLDVDGASTASALLRRWTECEGLHKVRLGPFDPAEAEVDGIACPVNVVKQLTAVFRTML